MDKREKKSLNRRLLIIYVGYLLILLFGLFSVVPTYLSAFTTGASQTLSMIELEESGVNKEWYGVAVKPAIFTSPQGEIVSATEGNQITTMINEGFVGLTIDLEKTPAEQVKTLSRLYDVTFYLDLFSSLFWLLILVLIAMIINSLRKAVRDRHPLPHRNILYMRLIGFLIIACEVVEAANFGIGNHMVELMATSDLIGFSNHFPIAYSQLIMGLLILFSAEVFAIGSDLSEEQKLTI
ncbi:MAG: DUF2975 domain-containing protein [Alistipes sp.]|nr:DUF2975 domain-containing protein [Alistipes sp.]